MYLSRLDIQHVRNLTSVQFDCSSGINVITGANAAGKTAVLEAIYLLSNARSFRTPRVLDVIQYGKDSLTVIASLIDQHENTISAGIEKSNSRTKMRFNGERVVKRSDQIQNIPLLSVVPESALLLNGPPKNRRHWLDWGLFHVEPGYFDAWYSYHQSLRQRNALLRRGETSPGYLASWEAAMVESGGKLRRQRIRYLQALQQRISQLAENNLATVGLRLKTPDENDDDLKQKLIKQRQSDAKLGHTQTGPHRAEVVISCNERLAARTLSRGEGKRLVILLMLAQAAEYEKVKGQTPIIIIDDLSAELDAISITRVIDLLEKQGMQTFITATSTDQLVDNRRVHTAFHVEHGQLQKMIN